MTDPGRHSPKQIPRILELQEGGLTVAEVCRQVGGLCSKPKVRAAYSTKEQLLPEQCS